MYNTGYSINLFDTYYHTCSYNIPTYVNFRINKPQTLIIRRGHETPFKYVYFFYFLFFLIFVLQVCFLNCLLLGCFWTFTISGACIWPLATSFIHSHGARPLSIWTLNGASVLAYGSKIIPHTCICHFAPTAVYTSRAKHIIFIAVHWAVSRAVRIDWNAKIWHFTSCSIHSTGAWHRFLSTVYWTVSRAHWIFPHTCVWHVAPLFVNTSWAMHFILIAVYWAISWAVRVHRNAKLWRCTPFGIHPTGTLHHILSAEYRAR